MSHSLIRSLVCSHRSLTRLLHTARFACAPLRSFARLLAQSLAPALVGEWNIFVQFSMGPESQWNDHEIDAQSAGPFTRSLALHTRSLSPHCSLCSRASLRSFVRSLARPFTRFRPHGKKVFAYELNASISISFNPLWEACL